jgi:hypothetical protein
LAWSVLLEKTASILAQPGVLLRIARDFPILVEFLDKFVALEPVFVILGPWWIGIAGCLLATEGGLLSFFEGFVGMGYVVFVAHIFLPWHHLLNVLKLNRMRYVLTECLVLSDQGQRRCPRPRTAVFWLHPGE